jgi:hypothetical protein
VIRVLRVMEYWYEDLEAANADMALWHVPPTGDKKFGPATALIKSTVMLPQETDMERLGTQQDLATFKKLTASTAEAMAKVVD